VEAEGILTVGRQPGDADGGVAHDQAQHIQEHVGGVGEQRQAARDQATHQLGYENAAGKPQSQYQPALAILAMRSHGVVTVVTMHVLVTVPLGHACPPLAKGLPGRLPAGRCCRNH